MTLAALCSHANKEFVNVIFKINPFTLNFNVHANVIILCIQWNYEFANLCIYSYILTLPYRCSLSDTTLDTMVLHSSLLVAISAHLFMFIPAYRETFPSHPHLFLPRLRLPFTMPSVIIRCRLSCLLTCP